MTEVIPLTTVCSFVRFFFFRFTDCFLISTSGNSLFSSFLMNSLRKPRKALIHTTAGNETSSWSARAHTFNISSNLDIRSQYLYWGLPYTHRHLYPTHTDICTEGSPTHSPTHRHLHRGLPYTQRHLYPTQTLVPKAPLHRQTLVLRAPLHIQTLVPYTDTCTEGFPTQTDTCTLHTHTHRHLYRGLPYTDRHLY